MSLRKHSCHAQKPIHKGKYTISTLHFYLVLSHHLIQGVLYLATTTTPATHMEPRLQGILSWVVPYVRDKWEKIFVQLLSDDHHYVMATICRDYHRNEEAW